MNEQTVLHRIYRECVDSVNDIWRRVSFWTQAVDVDLCQGETVQYRLDNLDLDSTKSKTLIEEYIEEAAEQHRLLTAQLDRLEDEIAARMPGLGMLSDTYKIIADANPEAATLYESRLAEAREEIAAMIKPVEDELERLRGLLSGAISNVEDDPLSDDILQKIQALRTKTDNDVADVNTNYIGEGFDPGVKAIGNSLTEAILNQEFNIHSVGAKFWEFYGFLGDEVVSSEDLYELETVDGMNVLDFLSGSYVNIDYNRKLNLCYIRGWVKIPFSDCYYRASGSHSSVFGAKYNIVLGTIGLIDIFPKMDGNSNQINLNTGIRYACIEYSNGFIYKINSYLGQGHPTYINITNFSDDPYSSIYGSWDHCKVIIPFLWDTGAAQTFYDSTSSTFGDEGEGSDTSIPEYVWVYFEDGYFDNAYVHTEQNPVTLGLNNQFVGTTYVVGGWDNTDSPYSYRNTSVTPIGEYSDENAAYNYAYSFAVNPKDIVFDTNGDPTYDCDDINVSLYRNDVKLGEYYSAIYGAFGGKYFLVDNNNSNIRDKYNNYITRSIHDAGSYEIHQFVSQMQIGDTLVFSKKHNYEKARRAMEQVIQAAEHNYSQITPLIPAESITKEYGSSNKVNDFTYGCYEHLSHAAYFPDKGYFPQILYKTGSYSTGTSNLSQRLRTNRYLSIAICYVGDRDSIYIETGTELGVITKFKNESSYHYSNYFTNANSRIYLNKLSNVKNNFDSCAIIVPLYNYADTNKDWNYQAPPYTDTVPLVIGKIYGEDRIGFDGGMMYYETANCTYGTYQPKNLTGLSVSEWSSLEWTYIDIQPYWEAIKDASTNEVIPFYWEDFYIRPLCLTKSY